jgi:hypothetical protein
MCPVHPERHESIAAHARPDADAGLSPITAGAALAPAGDTLTGTAGPFGGEELRPIDARRLAAD